MLAVVIKGYAVIIMTLKLITINVKIIKIAEIPQIANIVKITDYCLKMKKYENTGIAKNCRNNEKYRNTGKILNNGKLLK